MTEQMAELKRKQAEMLTAIDPSLEAKLASTSGGGSERPAVAGQGGGGGERKGVKGGMGGKRSELELEHLPLKIAEAIKNDGEVAESVECLVDVVGVMAVLAREAVEKERSENEEAIAEMQQVNPLTPKLLNP
jgi:hypothetical protein